MLDFLSHYYPAIVTLYIIILQTGMMETAFHSIPAPTTLLKITQQATIKDQDSASTHFQVLIGYKVILHMVISEEWEIVQNHTMSI